MTAARMAFFFAAYFFVAGVGMSYWPVWLQHRGVGTAEIGTIYMGRQIVTVTAILIIGWAAGRLIGVRPLSVLLASGACVMAASYEFAWGFWANLGVTLIWGMMWQPLLSIGEGICVTVTRQRRIDYSRVRVWGSVSFILGAVAVGLTVEALGPAWVLYVMLIGVVACLPAVLLLPRPASETPHGRAAAGVGAWTMLAQLPFVLFLVATGCTQASHAVLSMFGTLQWRALGISDGTISVLWTASIVTEIALFAIGGRIVARLGAARMIGLGAAMGVARWAAMPYAESVPVLLVLQTMHAFTFGATHLGAMAFLQRAMNANQMPLAQSLYYGLANGLLAAGMYQAVGWLYDSLGPLAYLAMTALCAVGLAAAWSLARAWNGGPLFGGAVTSPASAGSPRPAG